MIVFAVPSCVKLVVVSAALQVAIAAAPQPTRVPAASTVNVAVRRVCSLFDDFCAATGAAANSESAPSSNARGEKSDGRAHERPAWASGRREPAEVWEAGARAPAGRRAQVMPLGRRAAGPPGHYTIPADTILARLSSDFFPRSRRLRSVPAMCASKSALVPLRLLWQMAPAAPAQ